MPPLHDGIHTIGRMLLLAGLALAAAGALLLFIGKVPWIGRLPGDILLQKKNVTFHFPLATSIIISIVLSLLFWLLGRR